MTLYILKPFLILMGLFTNKFFDLGLFNSQALKPKHLGSFTTLLFLYTSSTCHGASISGSYQWFTICDSQPRGKRINALKTRLHKKLKKRET